MEREQYQNQIKDLLQAVETLLKSNKAMGERVTQLEKVAEAYDDLKTKYEKLEGELAMRKRGQHGKRSEKPKDTPDANPASDGSKDDNEDKIIEVSSKLEHALNYMHNNWKELIAYIDVGSVLIDNNCCYHNLNIIPTFFMVSHY